MSVAVPVIASIDPVARRIYLLTGVTSYHPLDDIYAEVRNLRRTTESLRHYDMFVSAGGNIPKNAAGTVRTPRYAIFNNCKVVPQDQDHDLDITGEQLYADAAGDVVGSGRDCMDTSLLSPGTDVQIHYEPPGSEVIVVSSGSGLDATERNWLSSIYAEVTNIEGGRGLAWIMRILLAPIGNMLTGPPPGTAGTARAKNMANSRDRIVAPVDEHGWRTDPPTLDGDP